MKSPRRFTFAAADGTPLAGTLYEPEAVGPSAVLIAGGLGVAQRHYAHFAAWLAARGHVVMSFDLRGMGASRQPVHARSLRGLNADMLTWADQDFAAAVAHLVTVNGGREITVIGHSLGLHHAGMTGAQAQARIAHAIGVASGAGYWRDWAPPSRRLAPLMLHVAAPLLVPLFGYFPGKRLRMVADLPAAAMRQWCRWCRHPAFAWGDEPDRVGRRLEAAAFPITAFSFTDDEAMTEQCTRKLLAAFSRAPSRLIRVAPSEVGLGRIGHLGAFQAAGTEQLWMCFAAAVENPQVVVHGDRGVASKPVVRPTTNQRSAMQSGEDHPPLLMDCPAPRATTREAASSTSQCSGCATGTPGFPSPSAPPRSP